MDQYKTIFFKEMPLFQKAVFTSTFSMQGELRDTACFFYLMRGAMNSYDVRGKHYTESKNAILKQCGRYVQQFSPGTEGGACEAIAVFLYPDLLKKIYKDEIPSFFPLHKVPTPKKFIGNTLVEQYMNNLT
ncbi:MAG: hypothetical protein AAFX53_16910, partial [Bacteroidota bacterium]